MNIGSKINALMRSEFSKAINLVKELKALGKKEKNHDFMKTVNGAAKYLKGLKKKIEPLYTAPETKSVKDAKETYVAALETLNKQLEEIKNNSFSQ